MESTLLDLQVAKSEALGELLGMVDTVIMASENPKVFDMLEKVERLRLARQKHDHAAQAYLDARLASQKS